MTASHAASDQKLKLAQRRKARKLLLQAVYQWQLSAAEATDIEAQFRAAFSGKTDWDFFHAVLPEVIQDCDKLDAWIVPCLDRQLNALDPIEKALLRLGTFELAHRQEVPYRVVINEYVELAKVFGATDGHKYINGILDKLARTLRPSESGATGRG